MEQAEINEMNREPDPPDRCRMCGAEGMRDLIDENNQIRCYKCGELMEIDELIGEDDDCGYDL